VSHKGKSALATGARVGALVAAGAFALGLGAGVTSAAWVDVDYFSAIATSSSFDIQAKFAPEDPWEDVGLPGDPDTIEDGFEISGPPVVDALPDHSYLTDIYLCNNGNVDGLITHATLEEIASVRDGIAEDGIVLDSSIEVTGINVNDTVIPADSCDLDTVPHHEHGVNHYTTVGDCSTPLDPTDDLYDVTTHIVIHIEVSSQ
jgi:hypothetical protein